jgi:hypothetical protein
MKPMHPVIIRQATVSVHSPPIRDTEGFLASQLVGSRQVVGSDVEERTLLLRVQGDMTMEIAFAECASKLKASPPPPHTHTFWTHTPIHTRK